MVKRFTSGIPYPFLKAFLALHLDTKSLSYEVFYFGDQREENLYGE